MHLCHPVAVLLERQMNGKDSRREVTVWKRRKTRTSDKNMCREARDDKSYV